MSREPRDTECPSCNNEEWSVSHPGHLPRVRRIDVQDWESVLSLREAMNECQKEEMKVLAAMSDEGIDTSDLPEVREFSNPRRGVFSGSPNRRAVPKSETV